MCLYGSAKYHRQMMASETTSISEQINESRGVLNDSSDANSLKSDELTPHRFEDFRRNVNLNLWCSRIETGHLTITKALM